MSRKDVLWWMIPKSSPVDKAVKKKFVSDYFTEFARFHCEFLRELTREYKEKGDFPVIPCAMLPLYYTDIRDKITAAVLGLLIKDDEKAMQHVREFAAMLGSHPYKWLCERHFLSLQVKTSFYDVTGGVKHERIANFSDSIYDIRDSLSLSFFSCKGLSKALGKDSENKTRLLSLVLGGSDGFGLNLWASYPLDIKCPLTAKVLRFIDEWMPDYHYYMTADEAIGLFGFDEESDFFYASLAWNDLCRRKPLECSRYSTQYLCAYRNSTHLRPYKWRNMIGTLRDGD